MRGDTRWSVKGKERRGRRRDDIRHLSAHSLGSALTSDIPRRAPLPGDKHRQGWAPAGAGFPTKNKRSAVSKKMIKGFICSVEVLI